MQESSSAAATMRRYWGLFENRDWDAAGALITSGDAAVVVGTGPGEEREGRDAWVAGVRETGESMPGVRIEPGNVRAFEEGSVAWVLDQPTWVLPDGARVPARSTVVMHKDGDDWRLCHLHLSLGVPDEKIGEVLGG